MPGPCPGSGLCSMYSGAYARSARPGGELASHNFTKSDAICSMLEVAVGCPMTACPSLGFRVQARRVSLHADPQTATSGARRVCASLTLERPEPRHRCRLEATPPNPTFIAKPPDRTTDSHHHSHLLSESEAGPTCPAIGLRTGYAVHLTPARPAHV